LLQVQQLVVAGGYGLCDKFSPSSFVGDIGITLYVHIFFVRAAHSYTDTAET